MKLKSHLYLGTCLLWQDSGFPSSANAIAFLAGCAEPDLNAATYLKGSFHGQRFRGHNYPNLLPRIEKLLYKLEHADGATPLYYYRLGKLSHYLADAFTYPHNQAFSGTLREHMQYEACLEERFLPAIRSGTQNANGKLPSGSLLPIVVDAHNAYKNTRAGIETDVDFITSVTSAVMAKLEKPAVYAAQPICA